jgi:glycosyltransferase involved in cell wall biosynthesis
MTSTSPLIPALHTYLLRRLSGCQRAGVSWGSHGDGLLDAGTTVGVVVGERSRLAQWDLRRRSGLERRFPGVAPPTPGSPAVPVGIWDRWDPRAAGAPPASFDVLAVVTTFNEEEIIEQILRRLLGAGIRAHVIDNWSTDATMDVLQRLAASEPLTVERFPPEAPSGFFELDPLLGRVVAIANGSQADWVVHHDADEIRQSPWSGLGLREALWAVQAWGYNCIDHTIVNFRPTDNSYRPGDDLVASFPFFEFGDAAGHFTQLKAWRPPAGGVVMTGGGHEVLFEGRRVFPYKFVTRHYPIRGQEHGERKILRERQARWSPAERARGWHIHYDHYGPGSSFVWDPRNLARAEELESRLLLQRLTGVCLPGNPRPGEGMPT